MKFLLYLFPLALYACTSSVAQEETMPSEIQDTPPYYQIPDYPEVYTAETVAARMIDGLGFRYYWATEGLRPEDLLYKPSEDARTTDETLDHLYGLSRTIVNATKKEPNVRPAAEEELSFEEKRQKTLVNFKTASDILKTSKEGAIEEMEIVFERDGSTSSFPFWNNINGPIADAIWHCGQVVSFRRASGNPFNSKASLFAGKLRE